MKEEGAILKVSEEMQSIRAFAQTLGMGKTKI